MVLKRRSFLFVLAYNKDSKDNDCWYNNESSVVWHFFSLSKRRRRRDISGFGKDHSPTDVWVYHSGFNFFIEDLNSTPNTIDGFFTAVPVNEVGLVRDRSCSLVENHFNLDRMASWHGNFLGALISFGERFCFTYSVLFADCRSYFNISSSH